MRSLSFWAKISSCYLAMFTFFSTGLGLIIWSVYDYVSPGGMNLWQLALVQIIATGVIVGGGFWCLAAMRRVEDLHAL